MRNPFTRKGPKKTRITEKDLGEARRSISDIARKENRSVESVRAEMNEAILAGLRDSDPAVQARWESMAPNGEPITPERLIAWASKQVKR